MFYPTNRIGRAGVHAFPAMITVINGARVMTSFAVVITSL
ncbi:protein of unknown function [Vibrio tapetis subsp. tapetis]|uniref:Uncharacterized protein n=1 Tax=Vibrio tapetis subsp. tapetis TaxID=1671868 RepID=A0A2N8ZLA7_9VIBR|nr:protein of unknown function [Vibrio tapetis subsp. tapetis]